MELDPLSAVLSDNSGAFGILLLLGFAIRQIRARRKSAARAKKLLQKAIASNLAEPLTLHPEINPALCVGCGTCTRVCPEGEVLKLIDHKPVLVSPTKCVGHGECEQHCPQGAIRLVFGTKTRGMDIPRITPNYETNIPGLYIAGELGGMGLIRNAVKQGHLAAKHAIAHLSRAQTQVDVLIVGAGPAGLAASLTAIAEKKSYLCIEQNSFGGTVYNFPRQKVVMTHPAELPLAGTMKFPKNKVSKEELLAFWNEVRKKTGLQIREKIRFEGIERGEGFFKVTTNAGIITAEKVILAIGVRGSPRKLGLPNEDLPKVAYNLIDPAQYRQVDVAVVGGGNAGVEAAQYLAKPELGNRVTLLVRGSGFDRCNEENKQIVIAMAEQGKLVIRYNSAVKEIGEKHLLIETEGDTAGGIAPGKIANDFLFVFAGAEMPNKFLMSLGIQIDKKFGEGLAENLVGVHA
ncbi:MAG: hypothetical protein A2X94_12995 [Bdellovibrionales bacterium GWB1_55_8]|nr:MAG: hypothetical protein A2X94_12995 [Bdellovibrionales bacterium GWB1_55_8]